MGSRIRRSTPRADASAAGEDEHAEVVAVVEIGAGAELASRLSRDGRAGSRRRQLTLPTELGPAAEVLSELRDRVRAVELERAAERGL